MHYCPRLCIGTSEAPRGYGFDYSPNIHEITFITQPTYNSFDKQVWNFNPLISVVFCLTLDLKKGSKHFRNEHWSACVWFKPICLILYCVVLLHYTEAGSKPNQTAQFPCFSSEYYCRNIEFQLICIIQTLSCYLYHLIHFTIWSVCSFGVLVFTAYVKKTLQRRKM